MTTRTPNQLATTEDTEDTEEPNPFRKGFDLLSSVTSVVESSHRLFAV